MNWETKKLCDSLYCDTRLIMVVWNQTGNTSKVSLSYKPYRKRTRATFVHTVRLCSILLTIKLVTLV